MNLSETLPAGAATGLLRALVAMIALTPGLSWSTGEQLIDAIMRSDFVFDRDVSKAPFLPLAYATFRDFSTSEFDGECVAGAACEFDTRQASVAAGLPLWVGQRDMVLAGGSVSVTELETATRDRTVYSGGVLGAWIRQASHRLQLGAFVFPQWHSGLPGGSAESDQVILGGAARYRHSARFHTYFGLVSWVGTGESFALPYLGLDWYPNDEWVVSMLMPWPSVVWAPSEDWLLRVGATQSDASWQFRADGKTRDADLSRIQLGVSYERRLHGSIWGGIGAGRSGFGRFRLSDGDAEFTSGFKRANYVELFINFRPES